MSPVLVAFRSVAGRVISVGLGTGAVVLRPAMAARQRAIEELGQATVALVDGALASPYADEAVRHMLESELAERAVARALAGDLVDRAARDLVRGGVLERIAAELAEGPELEALLQHALESPAVGRMVAQIVDSEPVRAAIADAVAQQSAGFADQVGDQLRERSRTVDQRLEQAAGKLWRRRSRPDDQALPAGAT